MIHATILEMKKLLHNLDGWLEKAASTAAAKKFDVNVLLQCRLSPDMFPLLRQIQVACDHAKFAAARAAGKEAPKHPDNEQTVDEARKRIATVVSYLDSFTKSDFEAAATRTVTLPLWEGKSMHATDYLVEYALPNFFFHLTTAYALLRHNGVDVGKRDYIGSLSLRG
ncbi:MAG TPA: DUF1993 domain-containing protein [Polyangiaceae bacterium]|nr:DUF1993 domain-containing protein [Polyangiaceae bacterium]